MSFLFYISSVYLFIDKDTHGNSVKGHRDVFTGNPQTALRFFTFCQTLFTRCRKGKGIVPSNNGGRFCFVFKRFLLFACEMSSAHSIRFELIRWLSSCAFTGFVLLTWIGLGSATGSTKRCSVWQIGYSECRNLYHTSPISRVIKVSGGFLRFNLTVNQQTTIALFFVKLWATSLCVVAVPITGT